MQTITPQEFKQFSQLLHDHCGISLRDDHDYLVQTRLSAFAENLGLQRFSELILHLQREPEKLFPAVINLMTTNETWWFRDHSCWNALEKAILPPLFAKLHSNSQAIKIWVAGCSTGQEAYSLAMLIDEICQRQNCPELVHRFSIQAMDISLAALKIAAAAEYNDVEIRRGLSVTRRDRYFRPSAPYRWLLQPNLRQRVNFTPINLTRDFSGLGHFDLILCRNVTIYFTPALRNKILSALMNRLTAEGALLVGATEALWGKRGAFSEVEFDGCVYLKNKIEPKN